MFFFCSQIPCYMAPSSVLTFLLVVVLSCFVFDDLDSFKEYWRGFAECPSSGIGLTFFLWVNWGRIFWDGRPQRQSAIHHIPVEAHAVNMADHCWGWLCSPGLRWHFVGLLHCGVILSVLPLHPCCWSRELYSTSFNVKYLHKFL
jgi:hypothetical protein